jgi:hypothetical protein
MFHERTSSKHKRKRQQTCISTSISQISISNLPKRRARSTDVRKDTSIVTPTSKQKTELPNYLKVSNSIFKRMLCKALVGADTIVAHIDTADKLDFVRIYAQLLNNVCYLQLEEHFWTDYMNILTTESVWSLPLQDDVVVSSKKNNLHRALFKSQTQVEKRHQKIRCRLDEAELRLNEQRANAVTFDIDTNEIDRVLLAFVRQGQRKLVVDFERRTQLVRFDAIDYRLLRSFYDLQPKNDVQVRLRSCHLFSSSSSSSNDDIIVNTRVCSLVSD